MVNLTKSVALDYADSRIHCNAICPGRKPDPLVFLHGKSANDSMPDTETAIFKAVTNHVSAELVASMHPLRGLGKPEDIVGGAIFLASDEARWITGTCLPIDGGYVAQ